MTTAAGGSPSEIPFLVAVSWVCAHYRVSTTAVHHAIRTGSLPAIPIQGASGVSAYAIRPDDAGALWKPRIREEG